MAQVTIDLGSVKGDKGDQGIQGVPGPSTPIATVINAQCTDSQAASAKAVYDLIFAVLDEDY